MSRSLGQLLEARPATHRVAVALALGLPAKAAATDIETALLDPQRLAAIVAGLSPDARRVLAQSALLDQPEIYSHWSGRAPAPVLELERCGLAYAFKQSYDVGYVVPSGLRPRLADIITRPYGGRVPPADAVRWVELPLQLAHDVAALWAFLSRTPVRVKTDGAVYQRDVNKLFEALPAIELHDPGDPLDGPRLTIVLAVLRQERLVRVRVADRPGADGRRELVATGDPTALLSLEPAALLERLLSHAGTTSFGAAGRALVRAMPVGVGVSLTGLGATLAAMVRDAGVRLGDATDFGLGLAAMHFPWLAGAAAIGVDGARQPVAVRAQETMTPVAGRIISQGNFELVALAPPSPAEALVLGLISERVPEQAHVFKLSRASVQAGQRSGALAGGVTGALAALAGELPQNVARSLHDWTAAVRPPLRLRTAVILDTGDAATADALLGGGLAAHVVERLGPTQLAIGAADVKAVETALRRAGHALEAGIDRVSGPIEERRSQTSEAELSWRPDAGDEPPGAKAVSTVPTTTDGPAHTARPRGEPTQRAAEPTRRAADPAPLRLIDADEDPVDVVLGAVDRGDDLFIVYAGAGGTTQHEITPYAMDGAALHAVCHADCEERVFWLGSIQAAVPVG